MSVHPKKVKKYTNFIKEAIFKNTSIIGILIPISKYFNCFSCSVVDAGKHRRNEDAIKTLAKNLRKYRKMRGFTIQQLANVLDVDYSQISRMERAIVNANISILFDIAKVLEIKPYQLLEE